MVDNVEIGGRLEAARKAMKLSREQAGERLGVSVSTIQAHENGRNALKPEVAIAYTKLYKISLVWLFEGKGPPDNSSEVVDILSRIPSRAEREAWLNMGRAISQEKK